MKENIGSEMVVGYCDVSIIIKAFNEEKRIAKAISTAIKSIEGMSGEVILADSYSHDRTVEIASGYPIKIVQLINPDDRCCGIGPQLGYQHSNGEFVYIMDGDMEMIAGFLAQAIKFLKSHPEVAGVGGRVVEMNTTSLEYLARVERGMGHMQAGEVDRLDMGGLYRRAAIKDVEYFSNPVLHSYEEFDLAVRLRAKGWKLMRIDVDSVRHHGHDVPPYQLLIRRWRTSYINGLGELLCSAWKKDHFWMILHDVRELRIYLGVLIWWSVLLAVWLLPIKLVDVLLVFLLFAFLPFVLMVFRKRSFSKGIFSVTSWCFNAAGLLRGAMKIRNAKNNIDSRVIQ